MLINVTHFRHSRSLKSTKEARESIYNLNHAWSFNGRNDFHRKISSRRPFIINSFILFVHFFSWPSVRWHCRPQPLLAAEFISYDVNECSNRGYPIGELVRGRSSSTLTLSFFPEKGLVCACLCRRASRTAPPPTSTRSQMSSSDTSRTGESRNYFESLLDTSVTVELIFIHRLRVSIHGLILGS